MSKRPQLIWPAVILGVIFLVIAADALFSVILGSVGL